MKLEHAAQTTTMPEYVSELEHPTARVERLKKCIDEAVERAPQEMKAVIAALQSLRGVAKTTAVTLAVEVRTFRASSAPRSG